MFVRSVVQGAVFLAASMIAIFAAVNYATVHASNHVTDIVLSNVGPVNVRFLFIYGTFVQFAILLALLLWRPNRLPFALKSMALFLLIRAVFVSLTHIAPSRLADQAGVELQDVRLVAVDPNLLRLREVVTKDLDLDSLPYGTGFHTRQGALRRGVSRRQGEQRPLP